MRDQRFKHSLQDLQTLIATHPNAFQTGRIRLLVDELVTLAQEEVDIERRYRAGALLWDCVPKKAQDVAFARQRVAVMVRIGMRFEKFFMNQKPAINWVIQLAGMTLKAFREQYPELLRDDWQALRSLGIRNDFVSRRAIELWVEADEAFCTDDLWYCPLHLVDRDVLLAICPTYQALPARRWADG